MRKHGDIDLTPAGIEGGFDAATASETIDVAMPPGFLERVGEEMDHPRARTGIELRHLVRDPRIAYLAFALEEESRAAIPAGPLFVEGIATALAAHLLGLHANAKPADFPARRLERVLDYIEAHVDGRLGLTELAHVAGMSSAYLRLAFKARLGVSVHRYVVQRRVERARVLLLQRAMPASEVALAAGFAHQTHMARWLRRELGMTPRELLRTS